eukprot:733198-Prymnesium_polylepis.1
MRPQHAACAQLLPHIYIGNNGKNTRCHCIASRRHPAKLLVRALRRTIALWQQPLLQPIERIHSHRKILPHVEPSHATRAHPLGQRRCLLLADAMPCVQQVGLLGSDGHRGAVLARLARGDAAAVQRAHEPLGEHEHLRVLLVTKRLRPRQGNVAAWASTVVRVREGAARRQVGEGGRGAERRGKGEGRTTEGSGKARVASWLGRLVRRVRARTARGTTSSTVALERARRSLCVRRQLGRCRGAAAARREGRRARDARRRAAALAALGSLDAPHALGRVGALAATTPPVAAVAAALRRAVALSAAAAVGRGPLNAAPALAAGALAAMAGDALAARVQRAAAHGAAHGAAAEAGGGGGAAAAVR